MIMSELKNIDKTYVANTYGRFPVEIISGKGSILVDTEGKEYIDLTIFFTGAIDESICVFCNNSSR